MGPSRIQTHKSNVSTALYCRPMDVSENSNSSPPKRPLGTAAVFAALVLGAIVGGMAVEYWLTTHAVSPAVAQTTAAPSADVVADVARLKSLLPTQSHIM